MTVNHSTHDEFGVGLAVGSTAQDLRGVAICKSRDCRSSLTVHASEDWYRYEVTRKVAPFHSRVSTNRDDCLPATGHLTRHIICARRT